MEEFDRRRALKTIWPRKWIVLAAVTIITGGMAFYVETATSLYTASLQILLDNNPSKTIDFEAAKAAPGRSVRPL